METSDAQPFLGSRAFNKDTLVYVDFHTRSDAMLASLQLFHDVPCRIMDLVFSIINHPEFDAKDVTMSNSAEVAKIAEEVRLKDRMVVMHNRSLNIEGRVVQAGFPQFVLEEVLDIIEAEKVARIESRFEKTLDNEDMHGDFRDRFCIEENTIMSRMSRVHRFWTLPCQKALGRSHYIGVHLDNINGYLPEALGKSNLGPWTSLIAVDLYGLIQKEFDNGRVYYVGCVIEPHQFEHFLDKLHHFFLGFENLKACMIRSHDSIFTDWTSDILPTLVNRNERMEALTLCSECDFIYLDHLLEHERLLKCPRSLTVKGVSVSDKAAIYTSVTSREGGFAALRSLTMKCETYEEDFALLSTLSTHPSIHLESLALEAPKPELYRELYLDNLKGKSLMAHSQCSSLFERLRNLRIDSEDERSQTTWTEYIVPFCSSLEKLTISVSPNNFTRLLDSVPTTICKLCLVIYSTDAKWWNKRLDSIHSSGRFVALEALTLNVSEPLAWRMH